MPSPRPTNVPSVWQPAEASGHVGTILRQWFGQGYVSHPGTDAGNPVPLTAALAQLLTNERLRAEFRHSPSAIAGDLKIVGEDLDAFLRLDPDEVDLQAEEIRVRSKRSSPRLPTARKPRNGRNQALSPRGDDIRAGSGLRCTQAAHSRGLRSPGAGRRPTGRHAEGSVVAKRRIGRPLRILATSTVRRDRECGAHAEDVDAVDRRGQQPWPAQRSRRRRVVR